MNALNKLITVVLSVLMTLLLLEVVFRLLGRTFIKHPWSWQSTGCHVPDPTLIYKPKKSKQCNFLTDLDLKQTAGANNRAQTSIVVLGDSFVWGKTDIEDTYPSQLEELIQRNDKNVRIINMGASGYGTD